MKLRTQCLNWQKIYNMIEEEKSLLLKDLCARLPYGVKVHTWYNRPMVVKCTGVDVYTNTVNLDIPGEYGYIFDDENDSDAKVYIDNVKPYLRPLSSMTEDEEEIYQLLVSTISLNNEGRFNASIDDYLNWLLRNHFDYRGLIEKGLAIAAVGENNPYKEKGGEQ